MSSFADGGLNPEHADEFFADDNSPVTLAPVFTGEAFSKIVDYPIVVMGLDKQPLRGRVRHSYHEQFTENERRTIARWNQKFYRWYLVSGTPRRVMIRLRTWQLLQRAVAFFASI